MKSAPSTWLGCELSEHKAFFAFAWLNLVRHCSRENMMKFTPSIRDLKTAPAVSGWRCGECQDIRASRDSR